MSSSDLLEPARTERSEKQAPLTGIARTFTDDEIIVSKTDPRGMITYANEVFMRISGYSEDELIEKPHSYIRHPHMPRSIFKLLWDRIKSGEEIFAYVVNRCKNGDHYWVLAHVTPAYNGQGTLLGYHSSRRKPRADALQKIEVLYNRILDAENKASSTRAGIEAGTDILMNEIKKAGVSYDQFILSL